MADSRLVFSIFADDIRQEVDGKVTHVGVYQGGMNVTGIPPVVLPKLAISTYIHTPLEQPFQDMELDLVLDDEVVQHVDTPRAQLANALATARAVPGSKEIGFNIVMVLQPFVLGKRGILRMKAKLDGQELVGNGLRIEFVKQPEAELPAAIAIAQ